MAKPFDVTTKQLVALRPLDWLRFLGLPGGQCYHRLTPSAETPATRLTGSLRFDGPDGSMVVEFRYQVLRVWEQIAEELLAGSLALLPLATLTDDAQSILPSVVSRMQQRIDAEATEQQARELWASTYLLMGLRYKTSIIDTLLKGVRQLEESTTYQSLLARGEAKGEIKGRLAEARRMLILLGNKRLGAPSDAVQARLAAITSRERIENLALNVSDVETWDDLLAE